MTTKRIHDAALETVMSDVMVEHHRSTAVTLAAGWLAQLVLFAIFSHLDLQGLAFLMLLLSPFVLAFVYWRAAVSYRRAADEMWSRRPWEDRVAINSVMDSLHIPN